MVRVWGISFCVTCNARVCCCIWWTWHRLTTTVDPVAQAKAIVNELKKYDKALYDKPRWLVLNKLDMVGSDVRAKLVADFVKRFKYKGSGVRNIGAHTRGLRELDQRHLQTHQGATGV